MPRVDKIVRVNESCSWEDALREFLYLKKAQGAAERTLTDYRKHVNQFFKRYPDAFDSYRKARQAILEYLAEPIAASTYNLRREYLKAFFAWCVKEGLFEKNPLEDIPKGSDEGRARNIDEDILKKLLELPNQSTFAGLRDYALILLTLDTGIRPPRRLSPCFQST